MHLVIVFWIFPYGFPQYGRFLFVLFWDWIWMTIFLWIFFIYLFNQFMLTICYIIISRILSANLVIRSGSGRDEEIKIWRCCKIRISWFEKKSRSGKSGSGRDQVEIRKSNLPYYYTWKCVRFFKVIDFEYYRLISAFSAANSKLH